MTSFIGSNNNVFFYLDDISGNVAIGSSNISSNNKLAVQGSIITTSNLTVTGNLLAIQGITVCNSTFLGNSNDPASAPTFSWKQESNIGIYHASNSTIGFSTVGSERMRIDYLGNLGIGKIPSYLLDVGGSVNFDSNLSIQSNLLVLQNSTLSNNLIVYGNANFNSNVNITGTLTVSNVEYITSNVIIYNTEIINSNLTVQNLFSNIGGAAFASNVFINSNLIVTGNIVNSNTFSNLSHGYFASNVRIASNLYVTGNYYSSNSMSNQGSGSFSSNFNIGSNLYVVWNIVNSNTLSNLGGAFFLSNVNINSNLYVIGNIINSNTFSNLNGAYFASNVNVNSNLYVLQNLINSNTFSNLNGAYFASNVNINGITTFNSNVNINGNLIVTNIAYVTSNIVVFNNNQTILQSNLTISSNLIVAQTSTLCNGLSNLGNAFFASNLYASNAGFYWNNYAFKYTVPINTLIISSNYSPGNSTIGSNNNPINGIIPFSIADTTFPYQNITNNGFQAPVKGIYMFNLQLGISSRGYDAVQVILTSSPSNQPLINQDTLSNIRNYSIATWETWTNFDNGLVAANGDGYIVPSSFVANINIIQSVPASNFIQCFAVTHYGARSNNGTAPTAVFSNTPLIISTASNNTTGALYPATAYNFFTGSLITNL